jgi:mono/diheme cytochrome c family protein
MDPSGRILPMAVVRWLTLALALAGFVLGLVGGPGVGRADAQPSPPAAVRTPAPAPLHGTPKGWRFAWPKGDPAKGREVFEKLECYRCHEVRGERFPTPSDPGRMGPELSAMGRLHPPEYLAESIINPGAVVERNRGYAAPDGSSKMPSYGESLTVQEAVDLVAYLRQLRPPPGASAPRQGGHGGHPTH